MRYPRADRVKKILREEISKILEYELKDPRVGLVTITRVDVTKDLRHAKVYFSVIGDESRKEQARQGVESATGFVRKMIGERVRLKFLPEIEFKYDDSIEYSQHISEVLDKIKQQEKGKEDVS
jgi:ribosome-binding factor A